MKSNYTLNLVIFGTSYIYLLKNTLETFENIILRCSKHFFDNSKSRFTANPKLALRAQTVEFAAATLRFELLPKKS